MSFKCSDKIKISDRMESRYFIINNPYMTDTMFELPVVAAPEVDTQVDTQECTVDFDNLSDMQVVLAYKGLTDEERGLIISKRDEIISYTAKLIRDEAKGKDVNFVEYIVDLVEGRKEANRALGIPSEL